MRFEADDDRKVEFEQARSGGQRQGKTPCVKACTHQHYLAAVAAGVQKPTVDNPRSQSHACKTCWRDGCGSGGDRVVASDESVKSATSCAVDAESFDGERTRGRCHDGSDVDLSVGNIRGCVGGCGHHLAISARANRPECGVWLEFWYLYYMPHGQD